MRALSEVRSPLRCKKLSEKIPEATGGDSYGRAGRSLLEGLSASHFELAELRGLPQPSCDTPVSVRSAGWQHRPRRADAYSVSISPSGLIRKLCQAELPPDNSSEMKNAIYIFRSEEHLWMIMKIKKLNSDLTS